MVGLKNAVTVLFVLRVNAVIKEKRAVVRIAAMQDNHALVGYAKINVEL